MDWVSITLTVAGLCLFETVTSIDNAIINAEVLTTMGQRARRWFLLWGIVIAVFLIRGLLPWLIVWATAPQLGFLGALTATFHSDARVTAAIETSAPVLLAGGGTFLIFLFFHFREIPPCSPNGRGAGPVSHPGRWQETHDVGCGSPALRPQVDSGRYPDCFAPGRRFC